MHARAGTFGPLLTTLSMLAAVSSANAIPQPTAAPNPLAAQEAVPAPAPTQLPLPIFPNALTPDDLILDSLDFTNDPDALSFLSPRGYGSSNYGGGNCPNCAPCNTCAAPPQSWGPAPTSHWVPATSHWAPAPVATVLKTQTYCPHCQPQHPTTYYKTTTYCPPSTTWRPQTSRWHTSYVAPAPVPVVTQTVVPQQVTTVVAGSAAAGVICSTLYAVGPGLPTTRQGGCGTILVVNGAVGREMVGVVWMGLIGGAALVLGGMFWI